MIYWKLWLQPVLRIQSRLDALMGAGPHCVYKLVKFWVCSCSHRGKPTLSIQCCMVLPLFKTEPQGGGKWHSSHLSMCVWILKSFFTQEESYFKLENSAEPVQPILPKAKQGLLLNIFYFEFNDRPPCLSLWKFKMQTLWQFLKKHIPQFRWFGSSLSSLPF